MATNARDPLAVMAMYRGPRPTGTVAITLLKNVSITDTLLAPELLTNARDPLGATATWNGAGPTGTVAITAWLLASYTVTSPLFWFVTYPCTAAPAVDGSDPAIARSAIPIPRGIMWRKPARITASPWGMR